MPRLFDRVRDTIRHRHYSYRIEEAYVHWIRRYILFHDKRHPRDMAAPEVTAFLNHLALDHDVGASTQNQALSALLFLYKNVLAQGKRNGPQKRPASLAQRGITNEVRHQAAHAAAVTAALVTASLVTGRHLVQAPPQCFRLLRPSPRQLVTGSRTPPSSRQRRN